MDFAKVIKELKPEVEETRAYLSDLSKPPAPRFNEADGKVAKLRATLDSAVSDLLIVVNGLQRRIADSNEQGDVVKSVGLVKRFKSKLDATDLL